eukprot:TRINITY_DN5229_c0_g4_i2.p1 TRINITY_DN5229_c0_g4~~TRINITY_DN5229_c0_g4_i2.p1  ORF type:complete len:124 (-),score=21.39 TRINITY_DN5229_c0_g4_i2:104-475(-)
MVSVIERSFTTTRSRVSETLLSLEFGVTDVNEHLVLFAMSAYADRVLDVAIDLQSNPIFGLKDALQMPFEDCVAFAKEREPLLASTLLDGMLFCARTFAKAHQDPLLTQDEVAAIHLYTQQSP